MKHKKKPIYSNKWGIRKIIMKCWYNSNFCNKENLQGPISISEKTSFRKISWSLEAARFIFKIVRSLWNLTGTSAALLPMCLSNFKAIRQFKVPISWLRDFTRSYEKMSFRILRRGPVSVHQLPLRRSSDWIKFTDAQLKREHLVFTVVISKWLTSLSDRSYTFQKYRSSNKRLDIYKN